MLSFGTELFLAFWIASYRVGLPARSPPPVRAATSMFLISFAKSLPRLASTTAFLCLVVAHLEWPDIWLSFPSRHRETGGAHASRRSARGGTTSRAAHPAGRRRSYRRPDHRRRSRERPHLGRSPRPRVPG